MPLNRTILELKQVYETEAQVPAGFKSYHFGIETPQH